jgi:NADPH-dependent curcumin reductase CurA
MRKIVLAARPQGDPLSSDFSIIDVPAPNPGAGQLLVETLWLSLDGTPVSPNPSFPLGEAPIGGAVSRVVRSDSLDFAVGDVIERRSAWAEYSVFDPIVRPTKVDLGDLPLYYAIGAFGMPGHATAVHQGSRGQPFMVSLAAVRMP